MFTKRIKTFRQKLFLSSGFIYAKLPERGGLSTSTETLSKPETTHKPIESAYIYKKNLDRVAGKENSKERKYLNEKLPTLLNLIAQPKITIEVQSGTFWSNLRNALKKRLNALKTGKLTGTALDATSQKALHQSITRILRSKNAKEHKDKKGSLSETRALDQIMADIAYRFAATGFDIGYLRAETKTGDWVIIDGSKISIAPKDPKHPKKVEKATDRFTIQYISGVSKKSLEARLDHGRGKPVTLNANKEAHPPIWSYEKGGIRKYVQQAASPTGTGISNQTKHEYVQLPNGRFIDRTKHQHLNKAPEKLRDKVDAIWKCTLDGKTYYFSGADKAAATTAALRELTATSPTQQAEIRRSIAKHMDGHAAINLPGFTPGKSRAGIEQPAIKGVWEYVNKKDKKYYLVEAANETAAKKIIKANKHTIDTSGTPPSPTFAQLRAPKPGVSIGEIHYDPKNKVTTLVSRPFRSAKTTKERMHLERKVEKGKTLLASQREQFKRQLDRGLYWASLTKLLKRQVGWGTMERVARKLHAVAKILQNEKYGTSRKPLYRYKIPELSYYPTTSKEYKAMDRKQRRAFYLTNRMAIRVLQYVYFSKKPLPPQVNKILKGTLPGTPDRTPRISSTASHMLTEVMSPPSKFKVLGNQVVEATPDTIGKKKHKHWLALAQKGPKYLLLPIKVLKTSAALEKGVPTIFHADAALKKHRKYAALVKKFEGARV